MSEITGATIYIAFRKLAPSDKHNAQWQVGVFAVDDEEAIKEEEPNFVINIIGAMDESRRDQIAAAMKCLLDLCAGIDSNVIMESH